MELKDLENKVEELEKRASEMKEADEKRSADMKLAEERRAEFYKGENMKDIAEEKRDYKDIAEAMKEKRGITLNGTGAINQINGLWQLIKQREPLLDRVSYFRGPNSQTQIGILQARPALPSKVAEGATSISPDTTAGITSKSLYPYTWAAVLPVSYETVLYSITDVEQRVPYLLAEAFKTAMCNNMFTGAGTNQTMKGLFASGNVASANLIETASATEVDIIDVWNLVLKVKDYDVANPVVIMNPAIYSALITEVPTGYDFLREELIKNKTIEGVEVVITGKAPTFASASAGDVVVWCGDLKDYAIALADEVTIEPIKKVGDTNTYFQAVMAFTGDIIDNRNVFGLSKKA